jgi:hypothetical protein
MSQAHVLDANALLDYFEDGPGSGRVQQLMNNALRENNPLLLSVVNWGEIFYILWQ